MLSNKPSIQGPSMLLKRRENLRKFVSLPNVDGIGPVRRGLFAIDNILRFVR